MEFFEWELDNGIGILTFSREKVLNALNEKLLREGLDFLDHQASNNELKVLILTGKGTKSFIAGADIAELETKPIPTVAVESLAWDKTLQILYLNFLVR